NPLLEEVTLAGISLDTDTLEFAFRKSIERMADRLLASPTELGLLQRLEAALSVLGSLPFEVNLWKVQNICYDLLGEVYRNLQSGAEQGDKSARQWVKTFRNLVGKLSIRIE
nr:glycoside hydrolase [candidate division Zixibacteria bacterium]